MLNHSGRLMRHLCLVKPINNKERITILINGEAIIDDNLIAYNFLIILLSIQNLWILPHGTFL